MPEQVLDLVSVLRGSHIFRRLSDAEIADVADLFSVQVMAEEQFIFKEKESADAFCFLLSGKVRLWRKLPAQLEEIAICDAEDYFGQDTLQPYQVHRVSAQARTTVTVAILSYKKYRDLLHRFPLLAASFQVVFKSYQLMLRQPLLWRAPRETVHYIGRVHPFFLWRNLLLPLPLLIGAFVLLIIYANNVEQNFLFIIAAILFVVGGGWTLWIVMDWSNDLYVITNRRVVCQERLIGFYDSQRESPLDAVLAEDIQTDFWGRWLGYGNLLVRTYAGLLPMRRIADVREIKIILDEQRQQAMTRSQRVRKRSLREAIDYTLRGVPPPSQQLSEQDEALVLPRVQPGWMQSRLLSIFSVRQQKGRVVTYRTHPFILIKRAGLYAIGVLLACGLNIWGLFAWRFWGAGILKGLLLLLSLVGMGFVVWITWDWRNDQYIVTENELVDVYKRPLGKEVRRSSPIENIQTIDFSRPNLLALLFDFGTVMIRVGNDTLTFNNVPSPASVQREIFERFLEKKFQKEKRQAEQEQERIVEWLKAYDEHRRAFETPSTPPQA